MIKTKRIFEPPEKTDGCRVLVDRLWPRGISKEKAQIDLWMKDLAPSAALRKWFAHDPKRWAAFRKKYCAELEARANLFGQITRLEKERGIVTLLYAARDEAHNNALVLRDLLRGLRRR